MTSENSAPSVLKLCSHCGGTRQELDRYAPSQNNKEGGVRVYCQCGMNTGWFDKDDEAIAAWNRRASDPIRAEMLEALKVLADACKDALSWADGGCSPYGNEAIGDAQDAVTKARAVITRAEME